MAGLGAHLLLKVRVCAARKWMAAGLLILVFIDFYPGPITNLAPITSSPADYWLATQPDIGAVAVFPFADEANQSQVYDTLIYQKPYLGGFFNANSPEQFTRIQPVMDNFPSSESIDMLKQLGVAYVIVDSSRYSNYLMVDQKIQSLGLRLLQICETEYVYGFP
jgi:hypothetical protein